MIPGDVVISTCVGGTGIAFSLSGVPDAECVLYPSMRVASVHARAYAARTRVDVWAELASGLLLVGRFRPASQRAPQAI